MTFRQYNGSTTYFRGQTVTSGTVYHVLLSGQSLALGGSGTPPLTTTQPYDNLMTSPRSDSYWLVPLIEYTRGSNGESPASAMGNLMKYIGAYRTIVSNNAGGGKSYAEIKKGTSYWDEGLTEVTRALANVNGGTYQFYGATAVHGEADDTANTTYAQYYADLIEWQSDLDTDVKAITGQSRNVILLVSQLGSHGTAWNIKKAQYDAAKDNANIYLAGPKYQFDSYDGSSHLSNTDYRWLGEYFGRVWWALIHNGDWSPLWPTSVTRSGAVITATFNVPTPPISFDTSILAAQANYGFVYADNGDGNSVSISSVAITDANAGTIDITLDDTPTGTGQVLRYAYNDNDGDGIPKGNLRDQDASASLNGNLLYNWCVNFEETIT